MPNTRTSDNRNRHQKPEQRSLSKYIEGENSPNEMREWGLSANNLKELAAVWHDIQQQGISIYRDGLNSTRTETKPSLPQWLLYSLFYTLLACIVFCFFAVFNFGSLLPESIRDAAGNVLIQMPIGILSFFAGKGIKKQE